MRKMIRAFIHKCFFYQKNNLRNILPIKQLKIVPLWFHKQAWGSDVASPLLKSCQRLTHLILEIHYGSQYCVTKATGIITCKLITRQVEDHVMWKYYPPHRLIMDQGSEFMSWEFLLYRETYEVKHSLTTIYNPRGISLVERGFQRT